MSQSPTALEGCVLACHAKTGSRRSSRSRRGRGTRGGTGGSSISNNDRTKRQQWRERAAVAGCKRDFSVSVSVSVSASLSLSPLSLSLSLSLSLAVSPQPSICLSACLATIALVAMDRSQKMQPVLLPADIAVDYHPGAQQRRSPFTSHQNKPTSQITKSKPAAPRMFKMTHTRTMSTG